MKIKSLVLMLLLGLTPMFGESKIFDKKSYSLIGIEAGYNSFDVYAMDKSGASIFDKKTNFSHAGIKIGAQTQDYRLFLSARYNKINNFDYAYMIGVELQYLINISKEINFFLGVNTGMADMKHADKDGFVRSISDSYFGGDLGINFHLDETMDLELGVKLIELSATNLKNDITYTYDSIVTTYISIIFKF